MNAPLALCALALLAAAPAQAALDGRVSSLRERYFKAGWAAASAAVPPPPAAGSPVEDPAEPAPNPDEPVHDEHSTVAHMFITRSAYAYYASRYAGGELASFIGEAAGDHPGSANHDTVVAGAFEEDKPFLNPWHELMSFNRHFWDYKKGDGAGWLGFDSSVERAHKYWTGGHDLDGKFDGGWSGGGDFSGVKDEGVLALYAKGDKAKAYWYLGHVAHLLEDLTVPAHNLLYPHPFHDSDKYETYMGEHFQDWGKLPSGPVESFDSLYALFRETAKITHHYDAGSGPGPLGADGDLDRGSRRKTHFTEEQLKDEGRVLMPLAYARVAALFVYFYKQVDHAPPQVELETPASTSLPRLRLKARAWDAQSGVDRESLRYEFRRWTGGSWTAWTETDPVFVAPVDGGLFSFRAWASDAAGNRGRSPVKIVRFRPAGLVLFRTSSSRAGRS